MSAWRQPGARGLFAEWVIEPRGYSGVYAIRDGRDLEVLYVGESHTGRLYDTLTRHFQSRSRGYHGPNYSRELCEVKVTLCPESYAIDLQHEWIVRLRPLDNYLVPVDDEDVPF